VRPLDRRTAEAHLADAIQHLATAGVVVRHLDRAAELTPEDRSKLAAWSAQVQSMLYRVNDVVGSSSLQGELTWPLPPSDGTPP
jgi:hypothetical protein